MPKSSGSRLYLTNVIKLVMIADRAITVRGSDDPDSDFAEDESYTSVMLSRGELKFFNLLNNPLFL